MNPSGLESRILAYGQELFARIDRQGAIPLSRRWWDDQLLELTTRNPALKVQLFRFVDTLPYLIDDPQAIARHLREYLHEADGSLPRWLKTASRYLPESGLAGRLLAAATRWNATGMARKFIAGTTVPEALAAVARMRRDGFAFTIDLLGEATITEQEADQVLAQYLELLHGLTEAVNHWPEVPEIDHDDRGPIPRVNVSVKLSALYSQFDPIDPVGTSRAVRRRLRPILALAKQSGAFVNFDMEQYAFKDITLQIFQEILSEPEFADWPDVGIAIQAYLRETETDLVRLLDWVRTERKTPVGIRLVKGAYWDYETIHAVQQGWPIPVWTQKWQSDACYERCSRFLLENYAWLVPAFGTHNFRSIAHALAAAEALGVPPRRYEFQMLYGMADPIRDAVRSLHRRVRIYTPYGQLLPGMAYLVRRLLENTSNDSFLRASTATDINELQLLRNPEMLATIRPRRAAADSAKLEQSVPISNHSQEPAIMDSRRCIRFRNEPHSDFARAENRHALAEALSRVRKQLGQTYLPVIDGQPHVTEKYLDSINPSQFTEVIGRVGMASADQARLAIAAAHKAFDTWRDASVTERAGLLRRVAAWFRDHRWDLAAWIILETGKPWREADADVAEAIDFCEYYALEAERLDRPRHRDVPGEDNRYFYEPRGVAVVIAPWNFPLAILTGMTAAAVVTGNPAIMKPAEQSSVVGAKLLEAFRAAGAPPGVVQYLPGIGEELGPVFTSHPDVALLAFTGSLKVALQLNEQAAHLPEGATQIKKIIAEMGGKNAIIIDADADLDEAVRGVVDSAFSYAGQKCSACSRVIVLEPIYEPFLHRLIEATRSLTVAPAADPGASLGPVIDAEASERIHRAIQTGETLARLVFRYDVGKLAESGYFIGPTIFTDVPESSPLAQEEIFGPVLAVMKATSIADALRIANGTRYALTGGVYSRSPSTLETVKRRFRVGNLYINRKCTGALVDRQPFGGFKLSGIGSKAGGPDYLLQFMLPRTITENTLRRGFAPELPEEFATTGGE